MKDTYNYIITDGQTEYSVRGYLDIKACTLHILRMICPKQWIDFNSRDLLIHHIPTNDTYDCILDDTTRYIPHPELRALVQINNHTILSTVMLLFKSIVAKKETPTT